MDNLPSGLDYPMTIVTAAAAGQRSGCLVGFHTQCSIDPLRWAVWISAANHTHRVALQAEWLAVHFPSAADLDLARLFGEATGDEVDKFDRCAWTAGRAGVPLLDRVPNRLVGRVLESYGGGDHRCFVLDVVDVDHGAPVRQLGFQMVRDFHPGHPA